MKNGLNSQLETWILEGCGRKITAPVNNLVPGHAALDKARKNHPIRG
jgi:hypothetical protein